MSIKKKILVSAIVLSLLLSVMLAAVGGKATGKNENVKKTKIEYVSFVGGSGTPEDPYLIENVTQLQAMNQNLSAHYALANDINASETSGWNNGKGFEPVGKYDEEKDVEFTGSLDGRNHTVSNLYIDRPDTDDVGLLGGTDDAVVKNIGLVDVNISGAGDVGGVVGMSHGTVENSYVTGDVNANNDAGILIGENHGLVSNSYTKGYVSALGHVGGLMGENSGPVENSHASGNVTGNGSLGGLAGSTSGPIRNSYFTGDVSGDEYVGGLVGYNYGSMVSNSYAAGNVSGDEDVGGLVGVNYDFSTVENSYAICHVIGKDHTVGGLVGRNDKSMVFSSYATGTVSGGKDVGGLVGSNFLYVSMVNNSYAIGNVSGDRNVGGLVGNNDATVSKSYAVGSVSGDRNVGGLVGKNIGTVSDSFWDVETSGQAKSNGGTGLNTREMIGENASKNMGGFDFNEIWEAVEEDDEDADEDGYPILQELSREEQVRYVYPVDPMEGVDEGSSDGGVPGFKTMILLLAVITVLAIYQKKKR